MKKTSETPVLIVGGGPVGLSLAIDLAWRGIPSTLVEKSDGEVQVSKVGIVLVRTLETCRRWGIADQVRKCGFPEDYHLRQIFCTSLTGHRLTTLEYPSMREEPVPKESPEKKQRCPQLWFNPILGGVAKSNSLITLRYFSELVDIGQTADGVAATVRDTRSGEISTIAAEYMVGCDGPGSHTRQLLGIEYEGDPALSYSTSVYIRSPDLLLRHDKGQAERYVFVGDEGIWGHLTVVDGANHWRLTVIGTADRGEANDFDPDHWLGRAFGPDRIPYEIDAVMPWRRSRMVVSNYRKGRVFLAGDAAHVMAPNGGFGMNTGIGDAVDLCWKLDAVLRGWAPAELLETYDVERRPIGWRNANAAAANFGLKMRPLDYTSITEESPAGAAKRLAFGTGFGQSLRQNYEVLGVDIGYHYEDSPICVADGTDAPIDDHAVPIQTSRPGHRAPHVWLKDGRSTLDLFGRGFTLLDFAGVKSEVDRIRAACARRHVPITIHGIDDPDVAKAYESSLVLVRPDGHVAWRGNSLPVDAAALIDTVTGARLAPTNDAHSNSEHEQAIERAVGAAG